MGGQLLCRRVDLSRGVRPELVVVCGRHSRTAPTIETRLAAAAVRYQLQAVEGTSSTARRTIHPLRQASLVALGRQRKEMVQAGRNVREVYEVRDLGPHGLAETPNVSTEISVATRPGKEPDRGNTICRCEHLSAEHALRFTANGCRAMVVTHCNLVVCARPNAMS